MTKQIIFLCGASSQEREALGTGLAQAIGGTFVQLPPLPLQPQFLENLRANANGTLLVSLDTSNPLEGEARRRWEALGTVISLDKTTPPYSKHRIARSFHLPASLVIVGSGLANCFLDPTCAVFDENVANLYPRLSSGCLHIIPSGEQYKTPETILRLWHAFGNRGIARQDCVTACGGGVTGDLTGFAAATWMRGIPWLNIPTTLLAMVDASTGGKTGCDLPEGKNLAGAFHSPKLVVIDTDFLPTLPPRELRSGRSEMLKHCIIGAENHQPPKPLQGRMPSAEEIAASLAVKVAIVSQDPLETCGKRMLLNCGHTIGHAVETASQYTLSHGEAVAIGCVEEARLASSLGLAPQTWPQELAECFRTEGLPASFPEGMTFKSLSRLMKHDKKGQGNAVKFALPCGWGDVRPVDVPL